MTIPFYKIISLKIFWVLVFVLFLQGSSWGQIQITEGFESGMPTSYTATTSYVLGSGTWTGQANGVIRGTSGVNSGSYSCQLRSQSGAQITSPNIATGGVSTVTFWASISTGSGSSLQVNYSTDGGSTWTAATGSPFSLTTSVVQYTATINSSSNNILVQFYRTNATVYIDDIIINANSTTPAITISTTSLSGFNYIIGNGPSTNLTFTISGVNLTSNVSLSAPTDYEISTSSGSGFGSSLSLAPTSGTLSVTTIYVRLKSGLTIGTYNAEDISCSATSAATKTVTCSGNVTASATSDIITFNGESATISSLENTASPLISSTGIQVWQFKVRDGGATLSDVDNLPTILNSFSISQAAGNGVSNWLTAIKTIELFDGTTNIGIGTVTTSPNLIAFSGLNSSIADNTEKTFSLRLSLNCGIGATNSDGDDFGFQISNGNVIFSSSGSGKSAFSATTTTNGQNVISVIPTALNFVTQPANTNLNANMTSVTVKAVDACGNTDLSGLSISLTSTGTLASSPLSATASTSTGLATFSTINHTAIGTGLTLNATSGSLTAAISNTFNILAIAPSVVTTNTASAITNTSSTSGGTTLNDGGASITAKGACWNTSTNPTTANSTSNDGTGTTDFSSSLTGLSPQTRYYIRAYATNAIGTGYGPNVNFWTWSNPATAHAGSFAVSSSTCTSITLTWTSATYPGSGATATGYIILYRTDGTNPTSTGVVNGLALSLPAGTTLGATITSGGTLTSTISGLSGATQYNFAIIPYTYDGTNTPTKNYLTSATIPTVNTTTPSCASDVIAVAASEPASISSTDNTPSPLTSSSGTQVWQITVRDGGGSSDADALPTIVNGITIVQVSNTVSNWSQAIKTIELFDGATNVGIATVTSTQIQFSGLTITVTDNSNKTLTLRMSLNCGIGAANSDGDRFGFSLSSANLSLAASGSSQKSAFSAAQSNTSKNVIDVTATQLLFSTQASTTGQNLTMSPNVAVTATDACGNTDIGFTGVVSITSTGTMTGSPQTATASAGIATFNSIIHSVIGTGYTLSATAGGLTGATSTSFDIVTVTQFSGGDMAIVGICVNQGACGGVAGEDEVSLVSFVDITPGTSFHMTDNGYDRVGCGSNTWGDGEGVITITRTTSTLTAGTIFSFRIMNNTVFSGINPDNNWTISYTIGTQFNLNSNDEQVYLMQGGTWNDPAGASNATYSGGIYMFAINTYTAWSCNDNTTTRGDLPLPLRCFSIMPSTGTVNVKYTGSTTPASQKDWIDRLNSISNWSASTDCATYNSQVPVYSSGYSFSINPGGFNSGYWTGASNTDWFDCNNWQNFKVPDSLANVTIDNVANDPIIGASPVLYPAGAICNDLLLTNTSGSGILTLNNALSYFSIKGNITNNGIITCSNGLTELRSVNAQVFSGSGATQFYNLRLNNTNTSGVSLSQDVTVSNNLTFTNGMLSTGANKLIITNTVVPTIFGYTSSKFINGNLRHSIANNTSTYIFPIGDGMATTNYKRFDLINNSLATTSYITASVANVPQGTPSADVDANLGSLATQWSMQLTSLLNSAIWTLTPDIQPTAGSYGVNLYVQNVANLSAADDDMFCPVKRDDASVTYADWSTFASTPTTIPNNGLAGRIYNGGAGYAQRTGYQQFSKHAIAKGTIALPIELLSFTANYNEKNVDLKWVTTSELNNDYFTVERSVDAVNFEQINNTDGAGNSTQTHFYSTIDNAPLNGISYYRLKQMDFDGKYSYSDIVSVYIENNNGFQIVNTFNSIDNSSLNVTINCGNNCFLNFELYDMTGKKVFSGTENYNGTNKNISIPTNDLSNGIYLLKIYNGEKILSKKVKVK